MTDRQPPHANDLRQWLSQASYSLLFKVALFFLGPAVLLFFLAWLIFSGGGPLKSTGDHSLPVLAAEMAGIAAQPGLVEIEVDGVNLGSASRLDPPRTVEIGDFSLEVSTPYLTAGQFWQEVALPANQAAWLENSIVNYVFRLPAGRAYQEMLENAAAGEETIRLTTAQGRQFDFAATDGRRQPASLGTQSVQQNSPAITLFWIGEEGDSYVLTGGYRASPRELEAVAIPAGAAGDEEGTAATLSVRLDGVDVVDEGRQLLVRGAATNAGATEGLIEQTEVLLLSDGLVSQIMSVNPPLPWRIPANNNQMAFAITFQRPPGAEAILTIGPQDFRLSSNQPLDARLPAGAPAASAPLSSVPYRQAPPALVDCDGGGYVFRSHFPATFGDAQRNYHAYLPPCYGHDGRVYPVLYLFHGSIQSDSQWLELGFARHADAGINDGRYPPFIAIMPDNGEMGNMTSGGERSVEGVTVNALIPFVDASFFTWKTAEGRSIGGISRGGYWALMIAFRHTGLFTSVAGHSSHLRFETDAPQYNPLATYAAADLSNMRIWLDWGEQDFLRSGQEQLRDALIEAGVPHEAHVNPGGHSDHYWAAYLGRYLDWHAAGWPRDRGAYPER